MGMMLYCYWLYCQFHWETPWGAPWTWFFSKAESTQHTIQSMSSALHTLHWSLHFPSGNMFFSGLSLFYKLNNLGAFPFFSFLAHLVRTLTFPLLLQSPPAFLTHPLLGLDYTRYKDILPWQGSGFKFLGLSSLNLIQCPLLSLI